jgi:hypothetical protein
MVILDGWMKKIELASFVRRVLMLIEIICEAVLPFRAVILNTYGLLAVKPVKVAVVAAAVRVLIFFTLPREAESEMELIVPVGKLSQVTTAVVVPVRTLNPVAVGTVTA